MYKEWKKIRNRMNEDDKIPLIIDCDPGVDDSLALMVARHAGCFEVKAVTAVSGNLGIEVTSKNALILSEVLGFQAPVAKGATEPLLKKIVTAEEVHGSDGMGGARQYFEETGGRTLSDRNAVETMREVLMSSDEKTAVIAIGPLTNIALLLKLYPEVREKILVLSIMGGGLQGGNVTALSEFNFYADPEAAAIVFGSGVPLILSGLHMTKDATLTEENLLDIRNHQGALSKPVSHMLRDYARNHAAIHDPCAVMALSHPEMFFSKDLYIEIDTREGVSRGMSYADERRWVDKTPNCTVLMSIDVEKFREVLVESLKY